MNKTDRQMTIIQRRLNAEQVQEAIKEAAKENARLFLDRYHAEAIPNGDGTFDVIVWDEENDKDNVGAVRLLKMLRSL